MNIFLISCVKKKNTVSTFAKDLYTSDLFKKAYNYAKTNNADKIFILSAKYGLIDEMDIIAPYDETLNTKKKVERLEWAGKVVSKLAQNTDLQNDNYTILAGERYNEYLLPYIKKYTLPVKGLSIGKQLSFYKAELSKNL